MEGEMISAVERREGEGEECTDLSVSDLPVHVQEHIFAKLPLHSISSSRLVCTEWNTILSSHSFLSSLQLSLSSPWLLLCDEGLCMAYCFAMQKWITLSLSFLGDHDSPLSILSTSPGTLFVQCSSQLYVCNPLRRSYNEIQLDLYSNDTEFIGIVQGENGEPYLLIMTLDYIQIYHYFQDSWQFKFEFEQYSIDEMGIGIYVYINDMVECSGVLFWSKCPIGVVAFRIQDDSFSKVRIAEFPFLNLLEDKGYRSFIVAYGSSVLEVVLVIEDQNIAIFELFEDEKDALFWKWRLFNATIPAAHILEYFDITKESGWMDDLVRCVCAGDYLCFGSTESPKVAAYNLRQGVWQFLPQFSDADSFRMMPFQPKLIV